MVVDGSEVSFNSKEINAIFKLRDDPDVEGNNLIESTLSEIMQDAVRVMAKPGSKWDVSPTGIRTLLTNNLLPEANLWVYFVKKRLIPTTHDKIVSRDRVMVA